MSGTTVNQLFDLSGRTAVVTGGTRGIGQAMALALAEAGADIILVQVGRSMIPRATSKAPRTPPLAAREKASPELVLTPASTARHIQHVHQITDHGPRARRAHLHGRPVVGERRVGPGGAHPGGPARRVDTGDQRRHPAAAPGAPVPGRRLERCAAGQPAHRLDSVPRLWRLHAHAARPAQGQYR